MKIDFAKINLVNLLPIPVFIMNEEGQFVLVNKAAAELYGYSMEEFLTMGLSDLGIDEEDIEIHQKVLEYSLKNKSKRRLLRKHKLKNGSVIDVDIQWSMIEVEGKTFVLSCIREITKQQEEIRSYERAVEIMSKIVKELSHDGELEQYNEGERTNEIQF